MAEILRSLEPGAACRCGGALWRPGTHPDTGRANLTCVACGHVRGWINHHLVFDHYEPDDAGRGGRAA